VFFFGWGGVGGGPFFFCRNKGGVLGGGWGGGGTMTSHVMYCEFNALMRRVSMRQCFVELVELRVAGTTLLRIAL